MHQDDETLENWLHRTGWADARSQRLTGGAVSTTNRLTDSEGRTVVVKRADQAPADLFVAEAAGLALLADTGTVRVPEVVAVGSDFLALADLGSATPDPACWARLGESVARLHLITADTFGLATDNYLGRLPQHNQRTADGFAFFAEQRILRYLDEPLSDALDPGDRRRLEQLAGRLPDLVPAQPASLLHGDLWHANIIGTAVAGPGALTDAADSAGAVAQPAVLDPACYYGWAEAELSMLWCCGQVPDTFWDSYQTVRPLADGWPDRMPLLHLREHLSVLAHFGDTGDTIARIRAVLDRY